MSMIAVVLAGGAFLLALISCIKSSRLVKDANSGRFTGATGQKGDQGAQGKQGDKGVKGDAGEPGKKGDKGDAGKDGRDGRDGHITEGTLTGERVAELLSQIENIKLEKSTITSGGFFQVENL